MGEEPFDKVGLVCHLSLVKLQEPPAPLTDDEAYERLHAALLALGTEAGASVAGDSALEAARRALRLLELGLLSAINRRENEPLLPPVQQ
jgi:hypothetical protein